MSPTSARYRSREYVRRIALQHRVEPDWSGRCACSHTAAHSAIASITSGPEVLRVRAREADPLDPVDRVASRAAARRSPCAMSGQEVAAVRVDVLAEQRDLADAVGGERRRPRRRSRPGAATRSRPRTAGTMQYAHFELQPIETCTHAWNAPLAVERQHRRRSGAPLRSRSALAGRRAAGAEPVAEVRDRARARRRRRRTGTARRSARAAPRRSSRRRRSPRSGSRSFSAFACARCAASRWSGFSRIVQVLKTTTSASSCDDRLAEPDRLEHALDPLRVVGVHLAAERGDEVPLHGRQGTRVPSRFRHEIGTDT